MTQKFIDRDGLKVLWNQVNLKDYPNNETLMAVIDAIDETKADKNELFSKSWNDLEDKPFYEEITKTHVLEWDGEIGDRVVVRGMFVKISDDILTNEEFKNCTVEWIGGDRIAVEEVYEALLITDSYIVFGEDICVVREPNTVVGVNTFVETGIYAVKVSEYVSKIECTEPVFTTTTAVPLPEKFLPESVAKISDIHTIVDDKLETELGTDSLLTASSTIKSAVNEVVNSLGNYYLKTEADTLHTEIEDYVDTQVATLVNEAPETLDTLGELAAAFEENKEVVEALDASITNKQDKVSDTLILVDTVTGIQHKIQIQNGQLVSFPIE